MGVLREYQMQAARFALDSFVRNGGAGLFLDMGLGKTLTSIAIMDIWHAEHPDGRFLVVAPALVAKNSWPDELERFKSVHSLDWASRSHAETAACRRQREQDGHDHRTGQSCLVG